MWDDGYEASHPIQASVTYPNEIDNLFDGITISKGAAIMRMVESIVGVPNLQLALRVIYRHFFTYFTDFK